MSDEISLFAEDSDEEVGGDETFGTPEVRFWRLSRWIVVSVYLAKPCFI